MSILLKYRKYLLENIGLSLLAVNFLLLLVVFFLYDPFDIIPAGYQGSSPLFHVSQKDVKIVNFESAESNFNLIRKEKIEEKITDKDDSLLKTERGSSLFKDKKEEKYEWSLEFNSDGNAYSYPADPERVGDLFHAIQEGRRYYSFSRTPETESSMGFSANPAGKCECLMVKFQMENNQYHTLYVGASTAAGESHVRLDDESKIFLVRNDILSSSGYGKHEHFRNRRLLPRGITADSITSINARFQKPERNVELSKAGGLWRIIRPVKGSARIGTLPDDVAEMKADQFPKIIPPDLNTADAFRLEIVYKKNFTDVDTINFDVLGSKENDIYFLKNKEGTVYQIYAGSFRDIYHPEENLLEKESLLEEKH